MGDEDEENVVAVVVCKMASLCSLFTRAPRRGLATVSVHNHTLWDIITPALLPPARPLSSRARAQGQGNPPLCAAASARSRPAHEISPPRRLLSVFALPVAALCTWLWGKGGGSTRSLLLSRATAAAAAAADVRERKGRSTEIFAFPGSFRPSGPRQRSHSPPEHTPSALSSAPAGSAVASAETLPARPATHRRPHVQSRASIVTPRHHLRHCGVCSAGCTHMVLSHRESLIHTHVGNLAKWATLTLSALAGQHRVSPHRTSPPAPALTSPCALCALASILSGGQMDMESKERKVTAVFLKPEQQLVLDTVETGH